MRWYAYTLILLMPVLAFGKVPIGFKKWQLDDTTFSKQIGGAVRNYEKPDKAWAEIVNGFQLEGDSVFVADSAVLRTRVNRNGTSKIMLTWGENEYTIEQRLLGIGWLNVVTRQHRRIDSTMNWLNVSMDSNIVKWTNVSPAVEYRVRKNNGTVEHGIFYKPAFLDSAVTLYDQRPDSLDIALANVMVYTLSGNIDDADSAIGDVPKRRLKDFGYYSFNLRNQRVRFPGCDTLPQIPVRQYWERRGTKIVCVEYVMMKHIKQVHEAYPSATIWHNDVKTIEGTTNVEDAYLVNLDGYRDKDYGGAGTFNIKADRATPMRVQNVDSELGGGATISACVCSLYVSTLAASGNVLNYRIFKPWGEGTENGVDPDDAPTGEGVATWNDWSNDDEEWTTAGCNSADDGGSDNSGDGTGADRKATAESSTEVTTISTWYGFTITPGLGQAWYDGTANENGVLFLSDGTASAVYNSTENVANQPFWVFTFTNNSAVFTGTSHIQDSWMSSGINSGTNYGAETYIWFHNNFGTEGRPIIKVINISDSVQAPIVACTLCLWQNLGASGKTGTLYAVKKDTWTEDGVCWDDWKTDYQWGTGGANSTSDDAGCNAGDGSGADRTTTAVGSFTTPGIGNWICVGVDVDLANDWLNETECESGVAIAVTDGANNLKFDSSEGTYPPQFIFIWGEEEEEVGTVRYVQGPGGARVVQSAQGASEVQGP